MDLLQSGTAWQQASTRVADRATDHTIRFETWSELFTVYIQNCTNVYKVFLLKESD